MGQSILIRAIHLPCVLHTVMVLCSHLGDDALTIAVYYTAFEWHRTTILTGISPWFYGFSFGFIPVLSAIESAFKSLYSELITSRYAAH